MSVSLEDTWCAMEEVVRQGYSKSIGLSNFNSQQIERILKIATIKPAINEVGESSITLKKINFVEEGK